MVILFIFSDLLLILFYLLASFMQTWNTTLLFNIMVLICDMFFRVLIFLSLYYVSDIWKCYLWGYLVEIKSNVLHAFVFSGRHCCYNCSKGSKFCCLACPNALCKKCVSTLEFTLVRGVQGLCCDCLEIVKIIELNLDHDSEGVRVIITWILEFLSNLF